MQHDRKAVEIDVLDIVLHEHAEIRVLHLHNAADQELAQEIEQHIALVLSGDD